MSRIPQRFAPVVRIEIGEDDERALIARVLAGDREAFGAIVERYAAQARRVARAVLRDPDDADDAAQDAFLSAFVRLERYDPTRAFGPWLMRIVANAATDRRRRRAVRAAEPLPMEVVARDGRPDREAERSLLSGRLRAALEELAPRRRLTVVLFDAEGYSHAEIAEILGVPEGTVRSDVFLARRRLRELLGSWKEGVE